MNERKRNTSFVMMCLLILSAAAYFAFSIASPVENPIEKVDKEIVKPRINYTDYARLGMIPSENECKNPLTPDFYEDTNVIMTDGLGNKYIILANRFNGQTCPVRI
jgi:hypothetical protein